MPLSHSSHGSGMGYVILHRPATQEAQAAGLFEDGNQPAFAWPGPSLGRGGVGYG